MTTTDYPDHTLFGAFEAFEERVRLVEAVRAALLGED